MSRHLNLRILALALLFGTQSALAGTLATIPLTLKQAVPSNVLFSLSVEYPTANTAAYQGSEDYLSTNTYLGIFDEAGCYDYDAGNSRFNPISKGTTSHICTGHWSGNFLNWATMTGLDEFRSAMTGGNRIVDTDSQTVLQRAYQSGQGGVANFTQKKHSGTGATPYPSTATLTITNQGQGSKMSVSLAGTGVANCANPTYSNGSFSCSITMADTNEAGSCSSWTGSGTNTSPYTCATFGAFPISGTPSTATGATKSTATTTSSASETVSCTNPTYAGSTFSCTLKDSSNTTGSCTTWQGTGTSISPFSCSDFGLFGSATFTQSSQNAATTFNSGSSSITETATGCSYNSSKKIITCDLPSGGKTTCTTSGTGTTSNPYICKTTSTWTIANRPSATVTAITNGITSPTGTKKYLPPATITYNNPNAYYYIPGYAGSDSSTSTYYYYSTYNVGFGGSTSYNVHVKVCDSSIGLESNCTPYGTTYKPTGSIQKYGNTMRFGLFSYYNAQDIDNAVMRSKAKYVAPTKWTESGSTSNTDMEWSATDGTFVLNPDPTEAASSYGTPVTNSGIINYINKFGYDAKTYKTRDNVGKLYYETLKYLRGLKQPTLAFYEKSAPYNDGFPVITDWDDPVQYSCQKNFIINMGDTHTHCDLRLPGGLFTTGCGVYNGQAADYGSLTDAGVDAAEWTTKLGTLEGLPNLATTKFEDNSSYYMSGLAYWAAFNGFRTFSGNTMKAQTFIIDVQEYGDYGKLDPTKSKWQTSASQYWYAAKYGGGRFNANGSPYDSTVDANPVTTNPSSDSWWTTSTQTTGKWPQNLLPAGNPASMKKAVDSAFETIAKLSSIDSAAGVSSGELGVSTGTDVFTTSYSADNWYGDVLSYHIDGTLNVATAPTWKASTYLNPTTLNPSSGTPPWKTRRVISFNDGLEADGSASTATNGRRGVQFKATQDTGTNLFTTSFSPRQQALLNQHPGAAASADGVGSDRVDYLRGDNSNEGNKGELWRSRSNSLGDLIHSSAVYVRFPTFSNIPGVDATTYKAFASAIASRTPVVYAGANDGMLHAFNASDLADDGMSSATDIGATADSGKEMLAYVPAAVYGKLSQLTSTAYAHQYYVDSTPVIADAQLGSPTCTASSDTYKCWRTIVAGGLKAGGQGIYALDGTNPGNFATANANSLVLWEFTDRDDADLGYTFSTPLIRKMNNDKWAVIFGNGYNNTEADGSASSDGRAYLYILMLDGPGTDASTGRGNTWTQDTNYFKIKLNAPGEGSTTKLSPANGLSNVQGIDKNNDNIVDYLYAGDRYGNIWKVDVSSTNPANWKSAFGAVANPDPLFTAVTSETTPAKQQVTTSPLVVASPNGGYMVMFGTGSFIDDSDKNSPFTLESFYGIWDKDDGTTKVTGRSQLQKQATLAYNSTVGYNLLSNCAVQYSSTATPPSTATTLCPSSLSPSVNGDSKVDQQLGWVLDLNFSMATTNPGERYISDPLPTLSNGLLTFVTLTPSADVCDPSYTSFEYNLNYLTGGSDGNAIYFNFPTGGGTPTAITTGFSVNGSTVTTNPSGRKTSGGGAGQNPAGISARGTNPYDSATSGTGCNPFVAGRACRNPNWDCTITPGSPPSVSCRKGTPTGEISWRQITN